MAIRILEMKRGNLPTGVFDGMPNMPFLVVQTAVALGSQSAPFNGETTCVIVQADEDCHVAAGADPTATTDDYKLWAANGREVAIWVTPGHKIDTVAVA